MRSKWSWYVHHNWRFVVAENMLDALESRHFYSEAQAPAGAVRLAPRKECGWHYVDPGRSGFGANLIPADFAKELWKVAEDRAALLKYPERPRGAGVGVRGFSCVTGRHAFRFRDAIGLETQDGSRGKGRRGISLTALLKKSPVRREWRERLRDTRRFVRRVNQSLCRPLEVPASLWTQQQHWGSMGNAFDYAMGSVWAAGTLESVFERVDSIAPPGSALDLVPTLRRLLILEIHAVRRGARTENQLDFFRGLLVLAHLDAMYRAGGMVAPLPFRWRPVWDLDVDDQLRRELRRHYPTEAAKELSLLLEVAGRSFPCWGELYYNPIFGGAPGLEHIGADGDLINGDTLVDFEVSIHNGYDAESFWQLLGYAALDFLRHGTQLRRVAIYNPRFAELWTIDVDTLAAELGGGSVESFAHWWRRTPAASDYW